MMSFFNLFYFEYNTPRFKILFFVGINEHSFVVFEYINNNINIIF